MLKEGGNFLTKFYKGKYTDKIMKIILTCFNKITISKPKAKGMPLLNLLLFVEDLN